MKGQTKERNVVISLLIATFLTAIEGTIVSTAMPKIVEDLGGSHLYTWVISVYLLALVITTPIFGKLADLYGRKLMFTIGVIIFLVGSMLSGFSQTMGQLVLFRLIQGLGAGALTTIPFTIIGDVFTFEQRARVQGLISSVWGIAAIVGPLTGGFIVDTISWHWIFFLNLPFGIISLILLGTALYEQIERKNQIIDYPGILTFAVSMSAFLYALTLLKDYENAASSILAFFVVAFVGIGLFIWIEARAKEPMLPLSLFKIRLISVANIAGFLISFILITVSFYIPLWVQGVLLLNATLSGIAMMPISVTWLIGAVLAGRWLSKTQSFGRIAALGIFLILLGCIGLSFLDAHSTVPLIMAETAIIGVGFGLSFTTFTVAVQSAVDWRLRGAAMGSNNLMRNLGQAIGIGISGLWLSDELKGSVLEASLHTIFIVLVIIAMSAFITTIVLLRKAASQ